MSKKKNKSLGYNLFFNMNNPKDFNWILDKKTDKIISIYGKRNIIVRTLTNRKFLRTIGVLTFISVYILVTKTFYYGKKVDKYDEIITKIEKKESTEAKIYTNKEIDNKTIRKVAASELINCINSKIEVNELPESVTNIINEINNYYNSSLNYFAFGYKDLYTGFTVTYNENQPIFAASSIKAPKDIYLYEMASLGKIDLEEKLTYTGRYYNTGSGVLKNKPTNTSYSIRTLLEYSTVTSDNAAHNMLMDRFGRTNILAFWKEKGTNTIFTQNSNWGPTNVHDAIIYMEELYRFYINNEQYVNELMNNFLKSYPKFIKGMNNENVASKSGWSGSSLHEMTIIFADNPYIAIGLSNLGDKEYQSYFNKVGELTNKLHTEYWKYKMSKCQNIKQY